MKTKSVLMFLSLLIAACSDDSLYSLQGSQWKVTKFNEQNVNGDEYVQFTSKGLMSWSGSGECYEKDLLRLNIQNDKMYAVIDDIDSTVELTYSIIADTLTMDFVAYKVEYVKDITNLSLLTVCTE